MIAIKDRDVVDGRELNGMEWKGFELNKSCIIPTHRNQTLNVGGRGSPVTPKMKEKGCPQGLRSGLHSSAGHGCHAECCAWRIFAFRRPGATWRRGLLYPGA